MLSSFKLKTATTNRRNLNKQTKAFHRNNVGQENLGVNHASVAKSLENNQNYSLFRKLIVCIERKINVKLPLVYVLYFLNASLCCEMKRKSIKQRKQSFGQGLRKLMFTFQLSYVPQFIDYLATTPLSLSYLHFKRKKKERIANLLLELR